ncbi:prolyl aminopeptidase [Pseudogemmobacter blasticus]|uniref:Proline iminopeptidase n=1 Tax=Fuscovulum blasticum DSM 2131 TaxID=1188250 RepID=A0A2T4JBK1_FUSBL|nr:prolyl aminopeptidase [Fuscovulum blasticum]AWD21898.1 prolyl aminopeptidase [Fuscovulum blasticum]PTE15282.1 prolyl aminopeptidase [Fuscovulum blasticum DSM 2131]
MDHRSGQRRAFDMLYPPIDPFDQRVIDVGDGHRVYVEQCGHPQGEPVVVFHGGPGGGCSPTMRRYFDPAHYRVILFDQRGCGRSRPHASVASNTTWHLVSDVEVIRKQLGIDQFIAFGGSWGATLALIYALTHPERVKQLVLRGVFLMTRSELDWFYGGGAGAFFPEVWNRFANAVPPDERGNLILAYHRRLFSGNMIEETRFGRIWAHWENALASIQHDGHVGESPADYARAFARLENHYFQNGGFLQCDGWILRERKRIAHIPATVVQGRYDMVCPPVSAWKLAEGWDHCQIRMIPMAGHALSEPGISEALVRTMDGLRA